MPRSKPIPHIVIDTNLVLSALVFAQGRLSSLRHAWQGKYCHPLVSSATAAELIRVLAYPKFKLTAAEQQELLADYRTLLHHSAHARKATCNTRLPRPVRLAFSAACRRGQGGIPGYR